MSGQTVQIELSPAGAITRVSSDVMEFYGYSEAELVGAYYTLICPVGPLPQNMASDGGAAGNTHPMPSFHRDKKGHLFRVLVEARARNEAPDGSAGWELNVARPPGEPSVLEDSEPLWSWAAVETSVEGIATINEKGVLEYANPAAQRLFGYSARELLGQNVKVLMPSPYKEMHNEYIENYLRSGVPKIIGIGREVTGRKKDGTTFLVYVAVSEVHLGDRRIFTGFIHDVTERKRAEEEKDRLLRELNKRNREINCLYRIGEALHAASLDADTFAKTTDLIHAAISHPDTVGTRLTIDDKTYATEDFQETPWKIEKDLIVSDRPRGSLEVFFLSSEPRDMTDPELEDEQNLLDAVARVLSEYIERSEAEAKVIHASKLASIGELAAGVGHEINNPVNGIINCADIILKNAGEDAATSKFATLIRSEADRIAIIVHNLLEFSRQDKEQYSPAQLTDIVDAVLSLCHKKMEKSHIALEVSIPENLPRIYCRSEQLQQVLMNLVINAMHALDERYPGADPGKILKIETARVTLEGKPFLRVTVEDHGVGISEANSHRLFDPFFTTKGRDKGTGLGLSVSNGIVKAHGGSIDVESELGRFSRFHVNLPLDSDGRSITARSREALLPQAEASYE